MSDVEGRRRLSRLRVRLKDKVKRKYMKYGGFI